MKDFITINSCGIEELKELLEISFDLKKTYKAGGRDLCLAGKNLAMIFEKPSLRTRLSFQVAMKDLGGNGIYIKPDDIGGMVGKREPIKDMARVFERYCGGIMARTFAHDTVEELAKYSKVPVINALTDWSHPCQAMADIMTIKEHKGELEGIKVARSLAFACSKFGMVFSAASPAGYELDNASVVKSNDSYPGSVGAVSDPFEAVKDADVIYTDTWVSMGQEEEKQQRIKEFQGYQVNMELLEAANDGAIVLHCLPAYRGLEITDDVMESENSVVFDQAENRLHFQRGLLKKLMSS